MIIVLIAAFMIYIGIKANLLIKDIDTNINTISPEGKLSKIAVIFSVSSLGVTIVSVLFSILQFIKSVSYKKELQSIINLLQLNATMELINKWHELEVIKEKTQN